MNDVDGCYHISVVTPEKVLVSDSKRNLSLQTQEAIHSIKLIIYTSMCIEAMDYTQLTVKVNQKHFLCSW